MELRGAGAIATAAVIGIVALVLGAGTMWWLSRNPDLEPRLRPIRERMWPAVIVGVLACLALLVIAGWLWLGPVRDGAQLGELPEASLRYPSSEELAQGDMDRVEDLLGTSNAAWWMILGTDGTSDEVEAFYRDELAALGWYDMRPDARTTSELSAVEWRMDRLRFRLAFMEPEEWHQRIEGSDRFATLYRIALIATGGGG